MERKAKRDTDAVLKPERHQGWSQRLILETQSVLDRVEHYGDGFVHLKNRNGSYGRITVANVLAKRLLIEDKTSQLVSEYTSVLDLINAGWAID